jgi:hypothetical protein
MQIDQGSLFHTIDSPNRYSRCSSCLSAAQPYHNHPCKKRRMLSQHIGGGRQLCPPRAIFREVSANPSRFRLDLNSRLRTTQATLPKEPAGATSLFHIVDGRSPSVGSSLGSRRVFCPLLNRQLHEHQPAGPHDARVGCHNLLVVHVTGDAGRPHRSCRAGLLHLGQR